MARSRTLSCAPPPVTPVTPGTDTCLAPPKGVASRTERGARRPHRAARAAQVARREPPALPAQELLPFHLQHLLRRALAISPAERPSAAQAAAALRNLQGLEASAARQSPERAGGAALDFGSPAPAGGVAESVNLIDLDI